MQIDIPCVPKVTQVFKLISYCQNVRKSLVKCIYLIRYDPGFVKREKLVTNSYILPLKIIVENKCGFS